MSVQPTLTTAASSGAACYSVHAAADPSVMPRVLEVFAKRGLVPSRWYSTLAGPGGEKMHIDIQVSGLEPGLGDRLAVLLRQLVYVETVLTSVPPVELPRPG
jgi:acetolactate synthase regulatory subunit